MPLPPPLAPINPGGSGNQQQPLPPIILPHMSNYTMQDQRVPSSVEVSDLRGERLTEAQAREQLAQILLYRFEKRSTTHEVDENGKPVKPTWDNAFREEQRDLDRPSLKAHVRRLDKNTDSVIKKRAKLPEGMHLQLDRLQQDLQRWENDQRYEFNLVQLEEIRGKKSRQEKGETVTTAKVTKEKVFVFERKKAKSKSGKDKDKEKDLIAVNAYFKRTPRSTENALFMLRNPDWRPRFQQQPVFPSQQQNSQQHAQQQQQEGNAKTSNPNIKVIHNHNKDRPRSPSSHGSSASVHSDEGFSDEGGPHVTPQSSVDSESQYARKNAPKGRRRHRRDLPEYYGAGFVPTRRLSRPGQDYLLTGGADGPSPAAPNAPQPRLPPVDVARLKAEITRVDGAFQEGVEQGRQEEARRQEELRRQEEYRHQHEMRLQDITRREEDLRREEELRRQDDIRRQEDLRRRRAIEPVPLPSPRMPSRTNSYHRMSPPETRVDYVEEREYRSVDDVADHFQRTGIYDDGRRDHYYHTSDLDRFPSRDREQGRPKVVLTPRDRRPLNPRESYHDRSPYEDLTHREQSAHDYQDMVDREFDTYEYAHQPRVTTRVVYRH